MVPTKIKMVVVQEKIKLVQSSLQTLIAQQTRCVAKPSRKENVPQAVPRNLSVRSMQCFWFVGYFSTALP